MKHDFKKSFIAFLMILSFVSTLSAGLIFDKSEYAARRQNIMAMIPDGIAVILGAQDIVGYKKFFQNNDFIYFSGVEIPNAILIIDGVRKESILFFTISERNAKAENISLELVHNPVDYTGIESYYPIERF